MSSDARDTLNLALTVAVCVARGNEGGNEGGACMALDSSPDLAAGAAWVLANFLLSVVPNKTGALGVLEDLPGDGREDGLELARAVLTDPTTTRRTLQGRDWRDAAVWLADALQKALEAAGYDPLEVLDQCVEFRGKVDALDAGIAHLERQFPDPVVADLHRRFGDHD
jgi:hypothetical protein